MGRCGYIICKRYLQRQQVLRYPSMQGMIEIRGNQWWVRKREESILKCWSKTPNLHPEIMKVAGKKKLTDCTIVGNNVFYLTTSTWKACFEQEAHEKIEGLKPRFHSAGPSEDYEDVALNGDPQKMVQVVLELDIDEKESLVQCLDKTKIFLLGLTRACRVLTLKSRAIDSTSTPRSSWCDRKSVHAVQIWQRLLSKKWTDFCKLILLG